MSDPLIADIAIGDMHIGHKTGIIFPYKLEDYNPNKAQRWLYRVFTKELLPEVKALLDEWKPDYVHGLLGGDMGDLNFKNRSHQYWAKTEGQVIENANRLLEPFFELCDGVHVLQGTKSHAGKGHQLDEAIADNFDNTIRRDEYNASWSQCDYRLGGVLVNARHYGKNRSKWGRYNLINSLGDEIILEKTRKGSPVPDIVYRFHFHWSGMTTEREKPIVVQVPSWQLPYDHIAEIDPVGRTPIVGGFVAFYKKGKVVKTYPLNYTYKERIWSPKK